MRSLSNKAIVTNSVGSIFSSVLVVVALIIGLADAESAGIAEFSGWLILFGLAIIVLSIGYSVLWVKLFGYELKDNEVKVEKGVISKSYDSIPYSRIQNVGIERSLLQRILGISTVDIQTAGSSGYRNAEGKLPGVEKHVAEEVRESIMEKARDNEGGGV
jgi:putative membrane protein